MKLPIGLLTIAALCLGFASVISPIKQPVVAYKKDVSNPEEKNKEWTIGIYDANGNPVSENIVFKKNTSFLSGKGKKLAFDWDKTPNYVYVAKMNTGTGKNGSNLAERYKKQQELQGPPSILKPYEVTPEKAPPGSTINMNDFEITIEEPKGVTRTITVYALNETVPDMPLKVQAVKKDASEYVAANLYGKQVTIEKAGKTYKLTIPKDKDFDVFLMPKLTAGFKWSVSRANIGKDTELAIGQNTIVVKQKSDRAQILKDDKAPAQ